MTDNKECQLAEINQAMLEPGPVARLGKMGRIRWECFFSFRLFPEMWLSHWNVEAITLKISRFDVSNRV